MLMPKANKRLGSSSRSRKPKIRLPHTVTIRTVSGRSRKKASSPSQVPPNIPLLERGVQILDSRDSLAWDIFSNWDYWAACNLVIAIHYDKGTFSVLKNRWGENVSGVGLDCLATFLYHPDVTDARELNMMRIQHNNQFAYTGPEQ